MPFCLPESPNRNPRPTDSRRIQSAARKGRRKMQRGVAAMVASSALCLVVALAVLEPAAGFAGPNALLPLRAR